MDNQKLNSLNDLSSRIGMLRRTVDTLRREAMYLFAVANVGYMSDAMIEVGKKHRLELLDLAEKELAELEEEFRNG